MTWQHLHQMTWMPRQPTWSRSHDLCLFDPRSPQHLWSTCLRLHLYEQPESLISSSSNELQSRDIAMRLSKRGIATSPPITHQLSSQRHLAGYLSRAKPARLRAAYETTTSSKARHFPHSTNINRRGTTFSHCNDAPANPRNVTLFQVSFSPPPCAIKGICNPRIWSTAKDCRFGVCASQLCPRFSGWRATPPSREYTR